MPLRKGLAEVALGQDCPNAQARGMVFYHEAMVEVG